MFLASEFRCEVALRGTIWYKDYPYHATYKIREKSGTSPRNFNNAENNLIPFIYSVYKSKLGKLGRTRFLPKWRLLLIQIN